MKELEKSKDDGVILDNFIKICMEYNKKHSEEVEKIKGPDIYRFKRDQ